MAVYYINKKCISKVDIQKEEVHTLCCPYFFAGCCRHDIKMHRHACTSKKNLPSGQAIFKKVYTLASIFFQRFYVYTCLHSFFFSYHFAGTLSPPGSGHFSTVPLCFSSAFFLLVFLRLFRNHFSSTLPADIYTFLHLFKTFAAHFLHFFFFVHYRESSIDEKYFGRKVVQN